MRADTKLRPNNNTLTLTLALSQREREFWGVVFIDQFEEMRTGDLKKSTPLPDEPYIICAPPDNRNMVLFNANC